MTELVPIKWPEINQNATTDLLGGVRIVNDDLRAQLGDAFAHYGLNVVSSWGDDDRDLPEIWADVIDSENNDRDLFIDVGGEYGFTVPGPGTGVRLDDIARYARIVIEYPAEAHDWIQANIEEDM